MEGPFFHDYLTIYKKAGKKSVGGQDKRGLCRKYLLRSLYMGVALRYHGKEVSPGHAGTDYKFFQYGLFVQRHAGCNYAP